MTPDGFWDWLLVPNIQDRRAPVPFLAPDFERGNQQDDELSILHADGHHVSFRTVADGTRWVTEVDLIQHLLLSTEGHAESAHMCYLHDFVNEGNHVNISMSFWNDRNMEALGIIHEFWLVGGNMYVWPSLGCPTDEQCHPPPQTETRLWRGGCPGPK